MVNENEKQVSSQDEEKSKDDLLLEFLQNEKNKSEEQDKKIEELTSKLSQYQNQNKSKTKNSLDSIKESSKSVGKKTINKLDEKTSGFDGSPISFIRESIKFFYELMQAIKEYVETLQASRKAEKEEAKEQAQNEMNQQGIKNDNGF